jgi:hypothetical protein
MRVILPVLMLSAVATPALAAPDAHRFTYEGESYEYVAKRAPDGDVLLTGSTPAKDFSLRVHKNEVSGRFGMTSVSFVIPAATLAKLDSEVPVQQAAVASSQVLAAN